ncbi:hypothetical protein J7L48_01220, partial [bacterium]|nr:hypothetical protein [bacterium]
MKIKTIFILGLTLWSILIFADYSVEQYPEFKLIFPSKFPYISDEFLEFYNFYFKDIEKLTGNKPKHFAYIIEDYGMYSNGMTNPVYNKILIMTHTPGIYDEIGFSKDWIQFVTLHETTHMAHLTYTSPFNKFFNKIFGNVFLPNMLVPNWYIEGIAVLSESQDLNQGRLNDGFFSAYEKVMLNEGRVPHILDATYGFDEFPYNAKYYIDGGNFFKYLHDNYNNPFPKLFKKQGYSLLSYFSPIYPFLGMDLNARAVLGKSFPKLWKEWQNYERKTFKKMKTDEKITQTGDSKYSLSLVGDKLYYIEKFYKKSNIYELNGYTYIKYINLKNNSIHKVLLLNSNIFEKMYVDENRLIYGKYVLKNGYENYSNNGMGYEVTLYEMNLKTKKVKKTYTGKIRSFTYNKGKYYICEDITGEYGTSFTVLNEDLEKINKIKISFLIEEIKKKGEDFYVITKHKDQVFSLYT